MATITLLSEALLTRLLVVDDDAATLLGLAEAVKLRLPDVEIQSASSAERALILMALERFDIILSDVRMPGMDGVTFLKEIKTLCPETTILLMSAAADRRDEALRLGAWGFLEKPFTPEELAVILRRAIRDTSLARAVREMNEHSAPHLFKPAS